MVDKFLQEGDIFAVTPGLRVYADVPEHFLYANRKGSFKMAHGDCTVGGELAYLAGEYVVYKTTFDGGGTGHGPGDVYPDGHHVFAEKMDDRKVKIDFYQSGCFTAVNANVPVLGTAKRQWVRG